ncbi:1944_t:CDS:2 [Entrophospora sp. SA101]|nr:3815_t:CDS:2 [Entrophospora sp. SA101]CAJ0645965.1 281_t:CDS:2 [Entrophospora sp. SA101]CAJ0747542.1 22214_t:CDS:2 [Entrophospora sp. SA101]CAJ0768145.1 1944_t:CDS:2 [Entrophospora sp. SA101]CAJ0834431.1 5211_t:CDS:2 [Entrophospora sp. SA101]
MSSSSTPKNEKPIIKLKSVNIPKNVVFKFYLHTILLLIFPISTYYLTLNFLFGNDTTKAALSAAGIANLIVFSYILVAIFEKDPGAEQQQQKQKDE